MNRTLPKSFRTALLGASMLSLPVIGSGQCQLDFNVRVQGFRAFMIPDSTVQQMRVDSIRYDFGDRNQSTVASVRPQPHTYRRPGVYAVTMTVFAPRCQDTVTRRVRIARPDTSRPDRVRCQADFSARPLRSRYIAFQGHARTNIRGAQIDHFWDLGDSTLIRRRDSVMHQYGRYGVYPVMHYITVRDTTRRIVCRDTVVRRVRVENPRSLSISGRVIAGRRQWADSLKVYLGAWDSSRQNFAPVDTFQVHAPGRFIFRGLKPNRYIVVAALDRNNQDFGRYLPTYFGQTVFWDSARVIGLRRSFDAADIHLIPNRAMRGRGRVNGQVGQSRNQRQGPVEGLAVFLLSPEGTPLHYVRSDAGGAFQMTGLPFGSYRVHAEKMGHTAQAARIQLDEDRPVADQISVSVNDASTVVSQGPQHETETLSMEIFPNPATDWVHVSLSSDQGGQLLFRLTDLAGKEILRQTQTLAAGPQQTDWALPGHLQGLYLLEIQLQDGLERRTESGLLRVD